MSECAGNSGDTIQTLGLCLLAVSIPLIVLYRMDGCLPLALRERNFGKVRMIALAVGVLGLIKLCGGFVLFIVGVSWANNCPALCTCKLHLPLDKKTGRRNPRCHNEHVLFVESIDEFANCNTCDMATSSSQVASLWSLTSSMSFV